MGVRFSLLHPGNPWDFLALGCQGDRRRLWPSLQERTDKLSLPTSDFYIYGAAMASFECQDTVMSLTRFESLKITQGKIHLDDG